jgi:hypothetical protein
MKTEKTAEKNTAIERPSPDKAKKTLMPIVKVAQSLVVNDVASFERAAVGVQKLDAFITFWTAATEPAVSAAKKSKQAATNAYTEVCKLRDELVDQAKEMKKLLLQKRVDYRIAVDAEAKRVSDAQAEILRKQQLKDAEKEAKRLERSGDVESANGIREFAKTAPAPQVAPLQTLAKQSGFVMTDDWVFEITNPSLVPRNLCLPSEKLLRAHVNAYQDTIAVPGVKITKKPKEYTRPSAANA